jgi:S1-C subfamily serine protease
MGAGLLLSRPSSPVQTVPNSAVAASAAPASVQAAVVDINTTLSYQGAKAAGTGMVLTPTGEILTNNHVVEGATSISVTDVGNGRTYGATVVGYDASDDVAVLQLTGASGLNTARLGDSSKLNVGDAVTALGNAGGVGGAPSEAPGSVTGLNQQVAAADDNGSVEQLTGLVQTSAQLVAGDSGGPLVDSSGHVVAMDTAGSARFNFRNSSAGGFAIPINKATSLARQIEAGQSSSTVHIGPTAFLGVEIAPSSSSRSGSSPYLSGAPVAGVVSGSPAAGSGLAAGDVITSVGRSSVASPTELQSLLSRYHPGDSVTVTWSLPSGGQQAATIQLANGPVG